MATSLSKRIRAAPQARRLRRGFSALVDLGVAPSHVRTSERAIAVAHRICGGEKRRVGGASADVLVRICLMPSGSQLRYSLIREEYNVGRMTLNRDCTELRP